MRFLYLLLLLQLGCSLQERNDFLIGRQCDPSSFEPCDPGQSCLPHSFTDRPDDFRCRDAESFEPVLGPDGIQEAPLAYCDNETYLCPENVICNADRIRQDVGARPMVCKPKKDVFYPPSETVDGGT